MSVFHSKAVVALIFGTIWPDFSSFSMLLIVTPLSNVSCSIRMCVLTISMSFVFYPISFIYIMISMNKSSFTMGKIMLPVPFVNTAITPDLHSSTMFLIGILVPFSFILDITINNYETFGYYLHTWFLFI